MWRVLFHWLFVKPVILLVVGLNVRNRERLPRAGPAIVVANHNSHADTVALLSLFPTRIISKVHPVAAADYFLRKPFVSWFTTRCIGILPLAREGRLRGQHPLQPCFDALERGEILVLFPEGTRGEPGKMEKFKSGIAHLVERHPQVPIVPIHLRGLGKVLPKGSWLPVPFFCDVFVGEPILERPQERGAFVSMLESKVANLAEGGGTSEWQ